MLKKKNIAIISMLTICLSITACSRPSASKPEVDLENTSAADFFENGPSYSLKLGHVQSETHPYHIGGKAFADKISEITKGKVKVELFPGSQLGGEIDMIESAQMGNLDLVIAGTPNLTNFDPSFTVFDYPFLFKDRDHAYATLDSEYGRKKLENLKNFGLVSFGYFENGFFDIMNGVRDIRKIEDLKGLNIRIVQNPVYAASFAAMGANPVPMPPSEVFTALQNGTVDGNSLSINGIYGFGWYKIQKTYMPANMFFCPLALVMSKTVYDSMPAAYQAAVKEASEYAVKVEREASISQEEKNLKAMVDSGIKLTEPENKEDWINLMKEKVYPKFKDKVTQADIDTVISFAK